VLLNFFTVVIYASVMYKYASVVYKYAFVTTSHFYPNLIYASKAEAHIYGTPP
jgi:hypothetical protein